MDRLVRKDFFPVWNDSLSWAWISFERDNDDRMPWEFHCHKLMTESQVTQNVVTIGSTDRTTLVSWVDKRLKRWKLYTAYCPHGSLHDLINDYARNRADEFFPENFVLEVAKALATAGLAMKKVEDGRQIAHR